MARHSLPPALLWWGVAAALAIGLFVGFSINAWNRAPAAVEPAPTPTADNGVSAAGNPPLSFDQPLEATMQAVTLAVLTALPLPVGTPVAPAATAAASDGSIALWLSAVTAITALLGFVSTALLNWRKEAREVQQARAELAKTHLEIEKLRREMAAFAQEGQPGPTPVSAPPGAPLDQAGA
ncbi:MAG: hypothetical protein M9936_01625 [Caldilinea sp.]|nr:hypothetical protein [Caldilineaceae bacterium]MCO5208364.1 hypothetical protein [Caldilinea sp.]